MFGKGDFYILRAKGDSMADAGIDEDDLLVIERNCPALEGDAMDRCWHSWKQANQTANSKWTDNTFQSAAYPAVASLNNSPSELRGLLHGILGMSTGEKKIRNKR